MNHSLGITQRKKSMEEWLIPELKEKDIVKDAIVTRTMKVPAGEFALIVTKGDIKQTSADTRKATTKTLNNLEELIRFPKRVRKIRKRKQGKELQQ